MGDLFKQPKLTTPSNLAPEQQALLSQLASYIGPQIGASQPGLDQLASQLLSSTTSDSKAQAERIFREALLNPAMDAFNRDVAPQIAGDYANIGGTLSSRRGQALTRGRTEVVNNATSALAGILPQIESFPLQQTLGQIQGLGAIQAQRFTPFQQALQFALTPTRSAAQRPGGAGWGLVNSAIGAAGFALGGGFGSGG